jgi:hypothetical protein
MSDLNLNILPKTLDPIQLEQQARYRTLGLTYISNNDSIIPRDAAGNIIMQEGSDTNPLLIIDPVTEQITTKSALRVLDTAFQYYKFPVTVNVTSSISNLDLTLDPIDSVYARYKPSENRKILSTPVFSGILMDEVVEGQIQTNINTYYITKEIKESGTNLRFRIKINHRYDAPLVTSGGSRVGFSIMKQGPDTELNRQFKGPFLPVGNRGTGGIVEPYEVLSTVIDVIISNNEFNIGDIFNIGANADQNSEFIYHTINAEQTYWVITDASKNVNLWNQEITNDNTI